MAKFTEMVPARRGGSKRGRTTKGTTKGGRRTRSDNTRRR